MVVLNRLFMSALVGAGAGIIGTGIGGTLAFFLKNPTRRLLSILMSFSSGLMLAVVCFDLLPTAFEIGGLSSGITGIVIGVVLIMICEDLVGSLTHKREGKDRAYIKTGVLFGIGIALHNFPEGLAIGSGMMAGSSYGISLSILIALQDIPEGIAMATPLIAARVSSKKVLLYTLLAGMPTGVGALIGHIIGGISPVLISMCLGFAGGAMVYITCGELIPESHNIYTGKVSGLGAVIGIIVGIILTYIIH